MVQWLGLCASTAGGTGSIPGRGTKILNAYAMCAVWPKKKKERERRERYIYKKFTKKKKKGKEKKIAVAPVVREGK